MELGIRAATEADFPAILSLIKELAAYESAPGKVTNSVEQMKMAKRWMSLRQLTLCPHPA